MPDSGDDLNKRIAEALNRQGYGFQSAVLREVHNQFRLHKSRWVFEVAEFPVGVNEESTRIDFLLWVYQTQCWILGECKRVNPAYSSWCFFRTTYFSRNSTDSVNFEFVGDLNSDGNFTSSVRRSIYKDAPYHVAIAAKTNQKGDAQGGGEAAIEQAAGQICIGLNGMVEFLHRNPKSLGPKKLRVLIPAIFTTARLYASKADLADTDLATGNTDPALLQLEEKPFLWYQYRLSPGIKHAIKSTYDFGDPSSVAEAEFTRSIAIVNVAGIGEFLQHVDPEYLYSEPIRGS
jgi:hypothetical protein